MSKPFKKMSLLKRMTSLRHQKIDDETCQHALETKSLRKERKGEKRRSGDRHGGGDPLKLDASSSHTDASEFSEHSESVDDLLFLPSTSRVSKASSGLPVLGSAQPGRFKKSRSRALGQGPVPVPKRREAGGASYLEDFLFKEYDSIAREEEDFEGWGSRSLTGW